MAFTQRLAVQNGQVIGIIGCVGAIHKDCADAAILLRKQMRQIKGSILALHKRGVDKPSILIQPPNRVGATLFEHIKINTVPRCLRRGLIRRAARFAYGRRRHESCQEKCDGKQPQ